MRSVVGRCCATLAFARSSGVGWKQDDRTREDGSALHTLGVKCVAGIGRLPDEELEATAKLRSLRSESLVHHDEVGRESLVKSNPDIGLADFDEMVLYIDLLKGAPPRGHLVQDPCEARFGWRAALVS